MDKARRAMNSVVPRAATMGLPPTAAAPIPKAAPVRSEPYRRVVATLPCAICGVAMTFRRTTCPHGHKTLV